MKFNLRSAARGVLALALAAGFSAGVQAQQKVFTLKFSTPALNDTNHEFYRQLKAGLESKSNGRSASS